MTKKFLEHATHAISTLDAEAIETLAEALVALKARSGRLFLLGVGGSAANCSHAASDFRKLCEIEAYTPTDNVAELTARTNDEGWESVFTGWLRASKLSRKDALLIMSVGGGNIQHQVSVNLIHACDLASNVGARIYGIIGKPDSYVESVADLTIVINPQAANWVTPISESLQAVVWHCLVSHPALQVNKTKW